jgi:hypothetical protein
MNASFSFFFFVCNSHRFFFARVARNSVRYTFTHRFVCDFANVAENYCNEMLRFPLEFFELLSSAQLQQKTNQSLSSKISQKQRAVEVIKNFLLPPLLTIMSKLSRYIIHATIL